MYNVNGTFVNINIKVAHCFTIKTNRQEAITFNMGLKQNIRGVSTQKDNQLHELETN